ncbi:hypothetical protein D1BOALGB6SA_7143 [Olavius sp. associated proteobacterium Delta 1]|nr:hypothetical protein D1BOALGB6SA_7143 [Olavius sp. associated proteobacterium Delta 1]
MAKLRNRDIQKVIQLFDNELLSIPRVSKTDKMKMRKKIVNLVQPALKSSTMKPEVFITEMENKLSNILRQFIDSYGFHNRLTDAVRKACENAEESSTPSSPSDDQ